MPMHPEFTAYLRSPHARVACVDCHVGSGAESYVRSKLNGIHQLYDVVTNQIPRPIETPVKNMRPASDTCEQCHWPEKFTGTIDRTYYHYLSDDANTPFAVRLLLKVGGGGEDGPPSGIHWHTSRNQKVEYIATDAQRQVIPWVRVTDLATGQARSIRTKSSTITRPNTPSAPWIASTATASRRIVFSRPMKPWTRPSPQGNWTGRFRS